MKEIILNGEVGYDITLSELSKQLEGIDDKKVKIILSSVGGSVLEGLAIYQYLKKLQTEGWDISIEGMGVVASISTIIFLSVPYEKRTIKEGTQFIIHLPFGGAMGTADEIKKKAEQIKELENLMINIYRKETTIPVELLTEWLAKEHILTTDELRQYKVAEVVKVEAVAKIKNSINMTLEQIKKMFGLAGVQAKVLLDANEREVNFPDVDDNAEPKIGDKAIIDGQPADGEVVMADGRIFVFENGILKEIKEKSDDDNGNGGAGAGDNGNGGAGNDDETKQVVAELIKKIEALTNENAKLKAELLEVQAKHEAFLKAVKSKFEIEPQNPTNNFGGRNDRDLQLLK